MKRTQDKPNWAMLIRKKREGLGESKAAFGRRFGVTGQAVFQWEAGLNDPPGEVTWWVANDAK